MFKFSPSLRKWIYLQQYLQGHLKIEQIRTCGTIAAMEVITSENDGYFNTIAPRLKTQFLEAGFLLRPLGNTLYLMPPYCITTDELESIYQVISSVLDTL